LSEIAHKPKLAPEPAQQMQVEAVCRQFTILLLAVTAAATAFFAVMLVI
jgi:hypothetical protein